MSPRRLILAAGITLAALSTALAPAPADAQDLFAANQVLDGAISRITPSGVASTFASGNSLFSPTAIAFDVSGNLYVANQGANRVLKFDSSGNPLPFTVQSDSIGTVYGITTDLSGNVYVSDAGANLVERITPAGVVTTFASGNGLNLPEGLAFDAAGSLYVVNNLGNSISKFDSAGNPLPFSLSGGILENPGAFTIDAARNLYVANSPIRNGFPGGTVFRVTPGGIIDLIFSSGLIPNPTGVAVDSAGDLFVSAQGNILKFDSAGNLLPFTLSGSSVNAPSGLAFAPAQVAAAPEPGSLMLLATGFSLVAISTRRRHG